MFKIEPVTQVDDSTCKSITHCTSVIRLMAVSNQSINQSMYRMYSLSVFSQAKIGSYWPSKVSNEIICSSRYLFFKPTVIIWKYFEYM